MVADICKGLAKARVTGSNPVSRSNSQPSLLDAFLFPCVMTLAMSGRDRDYAANRVVSGLRV